MRLSKALLLACSIFAATLAIFHSITSADFLQWDDDINIYGNRHIQGLTAENWNWIWTDTSYVRRYMPLGWLGWAIQYQLFGMHPWSWHFGNIVLHSLNAALVFLLIQKLVQSSLPKDHAVPEQLPWCAALGALIWAVHPLRVEAVAWASGRIYDQALTFLLISVLCYLRAA